MHLLSWPKFLFPRCSCHEQFLSIVVAENKQGMFILVTFLPSPFPSPILVKETVTTFCGNYVGRNYGDFLGENLRSLLLNRATHSSRSRVKRDNGNLRVTPTALATLLRCLYFAVSNYLRHVAHYHAYEAVQTRAWCIFTIPQPASWCVI